MMLVALVLRTVAVEQESRRTAAVEAATTGLARLAGVAVVLSCCCFCLLFDICQSLVLLLFHLLDERLAGK